MANHKSQLKITMNLDGTITAHQSVGRETFYTNTTIEELQKALDSHRQMKIGLSV